MNKRRRICLGETHFRVGLVYARKSSIKEFWKNCVFFSHTALYLWSAPLFMKQTPVSLRLFVTEKQKSSHLDSGPVTSGTLGFFLQLPMG